MAQSLVFCTHCRRHFPEDKRFCPNDGTPLAPVPVREPGIGTVLNGRFILLEKIAAGGMGFIYKGFDSSTRDVVAVKVLKPQYADNRGPVQQFFQEARAAAALDHESIVTIIDYGRTVEGYLYIAMELLDGEPLSEIVYRERHLDLPMGVAILDQVLAALEVAHDAGVIHRDLKPENIQVLAQGRPPYHVKVLDFGIAQTLSRDGLGAMEKRLICGTPAFMSPEQVFGTKMDGRADLYAVGILMFEVFTGDLPFVHENPYTLCQMQAYSEPPDFEPYCASLGYPMELAYVIRTLLAKDPDDRFPDAQSVRSALEIVLEAYEAMDVARPRTISGLSVSQDAFTLRLERSGMFEDDTSPDLRDQATLTFEDDSPTLVAMEPVLRPGAIRTLDLRIIPCSVCGELNGQGVLECSTCGASMQKQAKVPAGLVDMPRVERRTLSLVHVIIDVGNDDPDEKKIERIRRIMAPTLETWLGAVEEQGGVVCLDAGLTIRVVYGFFEGSRDFSVDAVGSALELGEAVREIRRKFAGTLSVRVGIATDDLYMDADHDGTPDVALKGSPVDIATRYARMAPPNGVVTSAKVVRASHHDFTMREFDTIVPRGRRDQEHVYLVTGRVVVDTVDEVAGDDERVGATIGA